MTKWRQLWISFKGSFWFIPAIVVTVLLAFAVLSIELDRRYFETWSALSPEWIIFEKEGMRTILATIAGSMMTVAGVVFSITILVLAQASNLYTSRVLRNFMKNRGNQFTLGLFVGIFIFCLFLMTNVHPTNNAMSAFVGFFLALVGVGYLIYFIHYVATSIQATEIVRNVSREVIKEVDRACSLGGEMEFFHPPEVQFEEEVRAKKPGYLQGIDYSGLFQICKSEKISIEIRKKTGDFIASGELICKMEKPSETLQKAIGQHFTIGSYRDVDGDLSFGFLQLVDIALKGLSPGINDPTTANVALDYLGNIFIHLSQCHLKREIYMQEKGSFLLAYRDTYESLLALSFPPIIENGKGQSMVLKKIEETLTKIYNVSEFIEDKKLLENYLSEVKVRLNNPEFI